MEISIEEVNSYFETLDNLKARGKCLIPRLWMIPYVKQHSTLGMWDFYKDSHSGRPMATFTDYTGQRAVLLPIEIFIDDEKINEWIAKEIKTYYEREAEYQKRCEENDRKKLEELKKRFEK